MKNLIVARFKDGKLLKGYTLDFSPVKSMFHLISDKGDDKGSSYEVNVDSLKAIFFVKKLGGNKDYKEKKRFEEVDSSHLKGLMIKVEFEDGEVIRGKTMAYSANRQGFFVFPVDPNSNNERIYVISSAVQGVETGAGALD
jgi:hypothetical protein